MRKALLLLFVFLLFGSTLYAWDGSVVSITDGDTIVLMPTVNYQGTKGSAPVTIRLFGIDCPENGQDFGTKATQFITSLVEGKTLRVEDVEYDQYKRLVAKLFLPDGSSVNEQIIVSGMAWVYDQYCDAPECVKWRELQAKAKSNLNGLWAMNSPVPPWQYRSGSATSQPIPAPAPSITPQIQPKPAPQQEVTVYITRTGQKYHRAGCRYLRQSSIPISLKDALARGFTPCSVCNPPTSSEFPASDGIKTSTNGSFTNPVTTPNVAENGDVRGIDNDGDGRAEPVYVRGYYRSDGTYVRSHYRARPR